MWGTPHNLAEASRTIRERYENSLLNLDSASAVDSERTWLDVLVARTNQTTSTYDGIDWGGERVAEEVGTWHFLCSPTAILSWYISRCPNGLKKSKKTEDARSRRSPYSDTASAGCSPATFLGAPRCRCVSLTSPQSLPAFYTHVNSSRPSSL